MVWLLVGLAILVGVMAGTLIQAQRIRDLKLGRPRYTWLESMRRRKE